MDAEPGRIPDDEPPSGEELAQLISRAFRDENLMCSITASHIHDALSVKPDRLEKVRRRLGTIAIHALAKGIDPGTA